MKIAFSVLLAFSALQGCVLARSNVEREPRHAFVTIAVTPAGEPAVRVYGLHTRNRLVSQHFNDVPRTLLVEPGSWVLDVDCFRDGAWAIVDGSLDFETAFEERIAYRLDCAPQVGGDNSFSLTRVPE